MTYLFHFADPIASFEPGGPGTGKRRLNGSWGDRLGADAWSLGRRAYERLRGDAGGPLTLKALYRFIEVEEKVLDDFFVRLNDDALAGRITVVGPDGETPVDLPLQWRDGDWAWKVLTFARFADGLPQTDEPVLELFGAHLLVAALACLDNAVLCSLSDDPAGVASNLLDAAWLVERVESLDRAERDAKALLARLEKARASQRARLRHEKDPKRAARDFVHECWLAWRQSPSSYPSASAFARAMLDKQPDLLTSEVVVTRWVRQWDRDRSGLVGD